MIFRPRRYLFHFGTIESLVTIAIFHIERLSVMFLPIQRKHLIKIRCRRALILLPLVLLISLAPVVIIYHITLTAPSIPCFFDFPAILMERSQSATSSHLINIITIVMTYIYLVELCLYMSIPAIVLPICSILLPSRVNHIMTNSRRLKHAGEFCNQSGTIHNPRGRKLIRPTDVKVTRELIFISIFTTVCLSPNIWWIPYGLSMQFRAR